LILQVISQMVQFCGRHKEILQVKGVHVFSASRNTFRARAFSLLVVRLEDFPLSVGMEISFNGGRTRGGFYHVKADSAQGNSVRLPDTAHL